MKTIINNTLFILFFSLLLFAGTDSYSRQAGRTIIKGIVKDADTGDPLPYVSIILKGTSVGNITDSKGYYSIETSVPAKEILFSFIGYQTETRTIKAGLEQVINVSLKLSSIALDEVRVKPGKKEYKNKNNPAVELIEKVISKKGLNRKENFDFLGYQKYEKIQFALSDIKEGFMNARIFEKFNFIFDNMDTTKRIGNDVLPIYIKEALSDHYYRKEPEAIKDVIRAEKTINLDEYLDNKGVTANLNYLYQNINIYDNEIFFLTNKFLSPIANSAPTFYRYYILDTIPVKDIKCIKLFFEPRNKADFLFHGNLYITLDSTYAIRKVDMGINKKINIDWVKDISITQDFDQFDNNLWFISKEEISIDFGILKNTLGLYGQRTLTYKDYKVNEPVSEKIFRGPETVEKIDPLASQSDYWEVNRPIPLSKTEKGLYTTVDSVIKVPSFRRKMNIVMLLTTEFLDLGKFEIGPVGNFYSFNSVEGTRLRFGGRTTTDFSKKITFEGYGAYGIEDEIFKYNAGITYSLTPRTIYQFPVKSLKISYQKDTRIPGKELSLAEGDNFLLSFKRGVDNKLLLNKTLKFEFLNEFENHFSYQTGYSYTKKQPMGELYFNNIDYLLSENSTNDIDASEAYLNLRYAPNETFYQGKLYRDAFPSKYPVMQLKMAGGSELIKNDYEYLRLQASISRRYFLALLGYTDISLEAGEIFGSVPYPLLFIHNANQTYAYQKNSYNLMNFLEFVSDKYVSVNIDHCFNGVILNKIPLIKKLKLREIITFKALYGGLSSGNNPDYHPGLYKFPAGSDNIPLTYTLEKKPYIEASIGLSNILRIFRVDVIKRFTYLDHPNVSDIGVRVQFRFDI